MAPNWIPLILLPHVHRAVTEFVDTRGDPGEKTQFVISDIKIGINRGEADEHGANRNHSAALALTNRKLVAVRMGRFTSRPAEIEGRWPHDTISIEESSFRWLTGGVVRLRMGDGTWLSAWYAPGLRWHFELLMRELKLSSAEA